MAYLIAESGGSRTDWALIRGNKDIYRFHTVGMNPNMVPANIMPHIVEIVKAKVEDEDIKHLYFYGSGLASDRNHSQMSKLFTKKGFEHHIIKTDLDASAISLFGNQPGIVCILGTGSNAGYFNGDHFEHFAPSLGYLMGDYGSGFHIAANLLRDYFYKVVPSVIADHIRLNYDAHGTLIDRIYRQEQPNRYIARFSAILSDFRNEEYTNSLIERCFDQFIELQLLGLDIDDYDKPIGFTGTIAYEFKSILEKSLAKKEFKLSKVIKQPIDQLIEYHHNMLHD